MKIVILKALVVAAYLGMLYMNYLANARPLNNRMTGEVSDAYPTLFTPAGLTFSIWGIIYVMLAFMSGSQSLLHPVPLFNLTKQQS